MQNFFSTLIPKRWGFCHFASYGYFYCLGKLIISNYWKWSGKNGCSRSLCSVSSAIHLSSVALCSHRGRFHNTFTYISFLTVKLELCRQHFRIWVPTCSEAWLGWSSLAEIFLVSLCRSKRSSSLCRSRWQHWPPQRVNKKVSQ